METMKANERMRRALEVIETYCGDVLDNDTEVDALEQLEQSLWALRSIRTETHKALRTPKADR
jgi:hypothetical protein